MSSFFTILSRVFRIYLSIYLRFRGGKSEPFSARLKKRPKLVAKGVLQRLFKIFWYLYFVEGAGKVGY